MPTIPSNLSFSANKKRTFVYQDKVRFLNEVAHKWANEGMKTLR